MNARYYDPAIGRFLTADSYLGESGNPPSLQRYLYGFGNPGRYVDPTGHAPVEGEFKPAPPVSKRKDFVDAGPKDPPVYLNLEGTPQDRDEVAITMEDPAGLQAMMRRQSPRGEVAPPAPTLLGPQWLTENTRGDLLAAAHRVMSRDRPNNDDLTHIGSGILLDGFNALTDDDDEAGMLGTPFTTADAVNPGVMIAAWGVEFLIRGELESIHTATDRDASFGERAFATVGVFLHALPAGAAGALATRMGRAAEVIGRYADEIAPAAAAAARRLRAEAARLGGAIKAAGQRVVAAGRRVIGNAARYVESALDDVAASLDNFCADGACGIRGRKCFVAGTLVATASGLVPIESLEVGDRVLNEDGGSETAVEGDWAVVEFDQPNPDVLGDVVRITLLRSREWFEELGAFAPGDEVYLDTGELGALGWATVRSIRTAAPVAEGEGRIVVGTFTHVNPDVRELRFVGTDVTIRATGSHRFYSLDRLDWVATAELRVGEHLQSERGPLEVASVEALPAPERVYNIEVETDHEYLVSELGVRSHNNEGCPPVQLELPFETGVPIPRIHVGEAGHHVPAVRKAEGRPFSVRRSDKTRPTIHFRGDPGRDHWRLHDAERLHVGERRGAYPGTDDELFEAYREAYRGLDDIRVDVRSPNGTHMLAEDVTPLEAVDIIEAWLRERSMR